MLGVEGLDWDIHPSILQSWSFQNKQWGSPWGWGMGGGCAPLTESRISNLRKGVWETEPRSGVWKKVPRAVLEFAWGLFNPQNLQSPIEPGLLLCGSDIQVNESRDPEEILLGEGGRKASSLLCLLPFWGNVLFFASILHKTSMVGNQRRQLSNSSKVNPAKRLENSLVLSFPHPRKGSSLNIWQDSPHRGRTEAAPTKIPMSYSKDTDFTSDVKHGFVKSPCLRIKSPHNYALI